MIKYASKTANLIAACFLLVACGGDEGTGDDMNPVGGNTGSTGGTTGSATSGASTNGASTNGNGGSTGSASGTNGSGTTGSSNGNTTSGSGTNGTSGGTSAGDDGGVDPGSSTTGGGGSGDDPTTPGNDSATSVQCGANVADCSLTTKSCCAEGLAYPPNFACREGTTCSNGQRAICDGPEDCGGKICCVAIPSGSVSCGDSCLGSELCHTDDDCSKAGGRCERGATFNYWGICK